MNKTAFCLLIAVLVPSISLCTLESTARYRQTVDAYDTARVARPAVQLCVDTDPAELAAIRPGESGIFEFSVANEDAQSPSEVCMAYWLDVTLNGPAGGMLTIALFYLDEQGQPHPLVPDADGRYAGWQPFGLTPSIHAYRLVFTLPAESEAPAEPADVSIDVVVTAVQTDT